MCLEVTTSHLIVLRDFLFFLKYQKQYSSHTLLGYERDINRFFVFLRDRDILLDWLDLTPENVKEYVAMMSRSELASSTIARSVSALRQFWLFGMERGVLSYSPWQGVVTPKFQKVLPMVLYPEEMISFLSSIPICHQGGQRLLAICEMLYATGLRVSELLALTVADVDYRNRQIRVMGKGQKERIVFFGEAAEVAVNRYLSIRSIEPTDPLFVNQRGGRLSVRSVQRFIQIHAGLMGYGDRVTPHTFRHSFATSLYDAGVDLRVIQGLLGHQSLSATQIYTHLSKDHLKAAYASAHPRA